MSVLEEDVEDDVENWGGQSFDEWSSSWNSSDTNNSSVNDLEQQKLSLEQQKLWINSGTELLKSGIGIIPSLLASSNTGLLQSNKNVDQILQNLAKTVPPTQDLNNLQLQLEVYKAQQQQQQQAQQQAQQQQQQQDIFGNKNVVGILLALGILLYFSK